MVEKPGPQRQARMKRGKRKKQKQKGDGAAALALAEVALAPDLLPETSQVEQHGPSILAPWSPHAAGGVGETPSSAGLTTGDVGEPSPQFQHATL